MRIALIPSAYAPSLGGVEELTAKVAQELGRRGHAVEVWTSAPSTGAVPRDEVLDGVQVHRFAFALPRASVPDAARWTARAARSFTALRRAHAAFRPDVLHVVCFSGNGAYATVLSQLTGTPLLVTLQGETLMDDQDIYEHSTALRLALRRGLARAQHTTACSHFTLADAIARFGCDPHTSQVVFNGVRLDEAEVEQPVGLPFGTYALALGRTVEKKGFDLLVRAFAAAVPALPCEVGLVVAGEGPALPALRALVADLGVADRVHFAGRLDRPEVAWAMRSARCFVMPSRLEPFGIVVLEAWRAGTGVIATSRGGAKEFVRHGEDGLVVDPFDQAALSQALLVLLQDDGSTAADLGAAGRARLATFEWSRIVDVYEDLYVASAAPAGATSDGGRGPLHGPSAGLG